VEHSRTIPDSSPAYTPEPPQRLNGGLSFPAKKGQIYCTINQAQEEKN
jgi:hypothetical protein